MEQEVILYKIEVDVDKAQKAVIDYQVELEKLKKEKKAIEEANKKGELSEEEYAKSIVQTNNAIKQASQAQKDATKQLELADKAAKANKNSYQSLTLQYQEAKKKLNELEDAFLVNTDGTIELTDAYKEQAEQVKKLKDAIIAFDQGVSDGRSNVGNYKQALEETIGQTSLFGVSIAKAKEGLATFTEGGIKGTIKNIFELGKAFIASPIGIFVSIVGLLVTAFQRSQKGAEFLRTALAGIGEVVDFVLQPLELLVDLVIGLADVAGGAFDAVKSVLGFDDDTAVKNAAQLEEQLIALEKRAIAQQTKDKESLALQEKLKTLRDSELKGVEENLKANQKLGEELRRNYEEQLAFDNEVLKNLQDKLAIEKNTKDQEELKKQINEQQQKIAERKADFEGKITEQITNQTSKLKEQRDIQREIATTQLELDILQGKIVKGSQAELEKRITLIKEQRDADLTLKEGALERRDIELKAELEIEGLRKEFNDAAKERFKEGLEREKARREALKDLENRIANDKIQANLAGLQKQLDDFDAQTAKLNLKDSIAIQQRLQQREELETQFAEQQKALRKQQEKEELQALEAQVKELKKLGINTAKLEAEEKNRIKLQAIADINKIELDLQLANTERAAQILELQLQKERDIRLNYANLNLQDARNAQLQAELEQKSAFEEKIKVAEEQYALELEQNRQNFDTNKITYEQYLANLQTASLNYEKTRTDTERQAQQERLDAQLAFEQARLSTVQAFTDAAIAIAGKNEEVARGLQVFQKALALFEVGLNLQRQLSNINLAGAKLDATLPGSGVAYRVFAVASAVAQGAKIIADIKKLSFASGGYTGEGFGSPDGTGYKVAGIVHENEYVVPERVMNTQRGSEMVRQLESMRLKPYAAGGLVLPTSSQPSATELAGVFISAMSQLPNPIVGVREIARVANQVETIEQLRTF